jgi:hypothetical protein
MISISDRYLENKSYGIAYIVFSSSAVINTPPISTAFSALYNMLQVWVLDTSIAYLIHS